MLPILTGLIIGYLVVSKQFYTNNVSCTDSVFIIDRFIDNDCIGKPLTLGITKGCPQNQGIRYGNGNVNRLVSFEKKDNSIVYTFENNIRLSLRLTSTQKIIYTFEMPGLLVVKDFYMPYKPIDLYSREFDTIAELR